MVAFGSEDHRVAERCFELYNQGRVAKIIVTGGVAQDPEGQMPVAWLFGYATLATRKKQLKTLTKQLKTLTKQQQAAATFVLLRVTAATTVTVAAGSGSSK